MLKPKQKLIAVVIGLGGIISAWLSGHPKSIKPKTFRPVKRKFTLGDITRKSRRRGG